MEGPHAMILDTLRSCQAAGGLQPLSNNCVNDQSQWLCVAFCHSPFAQPLSHVIKTSLVALTSCVKELRTDRIWPKAGSFLSTSALSPRDHHGDLGKLPQQQAPGTWGVFSPEPAPCRANTPSVVPFAVSTIPDWQKLVYVLRIFSITDPQTDFSCWFISWWNEKNKERAMSFHNAEWAQFMGLLLTLGDAVIAFLVLNIFPCLF